MEKPKFKKNRSRARKILKIMKDGDFWTATEILEELIKEKEKISLPGVLKNLKKLIREGTITYFDLNTKTRMGKPSKKYKKELLKIRNKKFIPKVSKYYIYFPLALTLRKRIRRVLGNKYNDLKYQKKIREIARIYGALELFSMRKEKNFTDDDNIKEHIKDYLIHKKRYKKGIRISKKEIDSAKESIKRFLEMFEGESIMEFILDIQPKKIFGKKYFLVGEEYIPIDKLYKFLAIIPFTRMMNVLIYSFEKSNEEFPEMKGLRDLFSKMYFLFIDFVKDSQIKI